MCTVDQLLDEVLDQPVMVQRLVDGPDSADSRLEVGPGSAYTVVVPQLQFIDVFVGFPVVAKRQIPMVPLFQDERDASVTIR